MSNHWERDDIQFTRLLAEINAVGLTTEQIAAISDSMDLFPDQVGELLARADQTWDDMKMLFDSIETQCVCCGAKVTV